MKIGLVILAAGNAARFGSNKLLAELGGIPVIRRVLSAVPERLRENSVIVTQYEKIAGEAARFGIGSVFNSAPGEGISRSIRLGAERLSSCDALLFLVADQPFIRENTLLRLASEAENAPGLICCAASGGRRANPCLFPKEFFPELLSLKGDVGGSAVIRAHPDRVRLVEVPEDELWDCDRPEDLEKMRASGKRD